MHVLAVGTLVVGGSDAKEEVAVLRVVHRVRVVGEAKRQTTVEDFAAHDVVLDVALAVAPGEHAVGVLLEAHHHARAVDRVEVVDRVRKHVPADVTGRVENRVLRPEVPFEGAARGVVPDDARADAGLFRDVVDEVEAVLEFGIDLLHFNAVRNFLFHRDAGHFKVDGRGVELDRVGELFGLAAQFPGVGDFDLVDVVGIETEDGDAAVRQNLAVGDLVLDFTAVGLRKYAHRDVLDRVAAVADDGRKRRDAVRVHHHFAEVTLDVIVDLRTRGTADGERGDRNRGHGAGEKFEAEIHGVLLSRQMAKRKRTAPPLRRMIALNGGSAPFAHSVAKSRFCVSPFPPNRNGLRVGSRVRADSRNVVFRFAEMMGKEANFRVFGARREGGSEGAFFQK